MRLIDADDLIRKIEKSYLTKGEKRLFIVKVRHMPTVDTNDDKYLEERDADAYESGFLEGHIAGYLKAEKNYARPIGKWIHSSAKKYHVICSLCKYESIILNANFCPNCGADMRGADNDVQ